MDSLILDTGIKAKDLQVLVAIVNQHPDKSLAFVMSIAKRVIKDINLTHASVLGYLIGYTEATEKTLSDYTNQFKLCQRQN